MIFVKTSVTIVMIIVAALVSFVLATTLTTKDDFNDTVLFSWIISSIGFGICFTALLFRNGVIHI